MEFTQREILFYLNGQPKRIPITSEERRSMYLDDGIYIGGVRDTVKLSWHLWNRYGDFVGCFGDLQLIGVGKYIYKAYTISTSYCMYIQYFFV